MGFRDLIPPMLNVLRTVGQQPNGEEVMYEILDVLEDLASQPVAVLNAHVPDLVPFLIEMIKADELEGTVRRPPYFTLHFACITALVTFLLFVIIRNFAVS